MKPTSRSHKHICICTAAAACLLAPALRAQESTPIPPEIESAVDRGLEWLAKTQERDGSWTAAGSRGGRSAAVTGLAAMAFMARGHVPGQGPYGDALNRAVDYILTLQQKDGTLASADLSQPMYDHGICTVMLCESYGMLDDRRQELAKAAIAKAVRVILNAQSIRKSPEDQGGWRYQTNANDSDISVSGWQLMALRGAANVGAAVPPAAIDAGITYIKRRATGNGGFSYMGGRNMDDTAAARTGTGVLSLILLGKQDAGEVKAGGDYLLTHPATQGTSHYFYSVYYCAQAGWQLGGKYWTNINATISRDLLKKQQRNGSWNVSGGSEDQGGEAYATAMSILAMTVQYRYLPIYQR